MRRLSVLLLLSSCLLATLPSVAAQASTSTTTPALTIPADESPHRSAWDEWWYFTGHLEGSDGTGKKREYGFELTYFRNRPYFYVGSSFYAVNVAVTDISRGTFKYNANTYSLQTDYLPADGGFDVSIGNTHMNGRDGTNRATAAFTDGSYALNLNLNQAAPAALHHDDGYTPYGTFGTSFYYSFTKLAVSGTINDHGVQIPVTGKAWFDHQWGDWRYRSGGWDWYSVQLEDDTEYMLYLLKDGNGNLVQKLGTQVKADGSTVNLDPALIGATATGTWRSPHTGYTYTSGWIVTVPGGKLTVTPRVLDQELEFLGATGDKYWEGACLVTGTVNGKRVTGKGYTELTPPGPVKQF